MNRRTILCSSSAIAALALAGIKVTRGTDVAAGYRVVHSDAEWRKLLSPAAYDVLRRDGTEPPFTSPLLHETQAGIFHCAGCACRSFRRQRNTTAAPAGRASGTTCLMRSGHAKTTASAWCGPRCFAASAAAISDMCSRTDRRPQGSDTA
jgi:hypothetical protein